MNIFKTLSYAAIALGLTSIATASSAQMSYYAGGGLAYSMVDSGPSSNQGNLVGIGITYGMKVDSGNMFYGGEIDADINVGGELTFPGNGASCADGYADDAYFCSQTATARFRGIVGTSAGSFDVFGSLGYGIIYGTGAIEGDGSSATAASGGLTYGVGAQTQLSGGTLRFEIIQDNFNASLIAACCGGEQSWTATTAKVSYLWSF